MPPKRTVKIDGSGEPLPWESPMQDGNWKNSTTCRNKFPNSRGTTKVPTEYPNPNALKQSYQPTTTACNQTARRPNPESVFIPSRKNNRDPPVEERELTQNSYSIKKSGGYNTLRYNFSNNKIV